MEKRRKLFEESKMTIEGLILIVSYLIGSISFSYIIAKLVKGIDIRKYGTKNAGTSNVFLVVGPVAGILTLIGDVGKGAVAVFLAQWLAMPDYIILLAGISAIVGHCFPIFLKFKGGKGMATSFGVIIPLAPIELLIVLGILVLLAFIIKRLTLSLLVSLSLLPLLAWYFNRSLTIIIGIGIIVLSRWVIDAFNFKEVLAGTDYQRLISKIKEGG